MLEDMGHHFQQYFSYIVAVSFIGGGNPEYTEKTINMLQVTDKLYHIMLYLEHLVISGIQTHNLSDCTGSCKSKNHMMTTSTASVQYNSFT